MLLTSKGGETSVFFVEKTILVKIFILSIFEWPFHTGLTVYTALLNFYPVNLQHSSCKHVFSIRVENSVDPDQMAFRWLCQKPSDLDLQCFQKRINPGSAGQGLIIKSIFSHCYEHFLYQLHFLSLF